ncbi:alanine--tRNA ligase [Jeotgalicoccus meleagridis]|uniref:Alanine--tRNA ligase n=1 Tax=Jeotgalicoccus meleagridis TaxID=2759181 RepID=A0A6V7RJX3_9STAP|nr:alanine--tRNA ligase [Jeotgalicoccus meleagridis]CAD2078443.1 Alanine--tRNA ligase [Jeotgalicoccus meleagridis]
MKRLSGNEIRQLFLDYFKDHNHMVEPSAPLVPIDDDSLLWINSGVATLKKYFDGRVVPDNPRIVNAQKAIRTNDIENVGFTARHHTFFEMLGNFSIGDYFKEEAIIRAWEFLTDDEWIGFDKDRLYVTVHPEDMDAFNIWKNVIGLSEDRIIRIEGNFWDIGEGPCGPNSEIFYDRGETYDDFSPLEEMYPGGENERYLEIWNLVFSEFNHNKDGSYTPLPKQNIDTGMGLERITSVIQDAKTNFDTDLFTPIIKEIEKVSGKKYGVSDSEDTAFKVISDHIRTVAFAIADGALPSNEGRGYVLRRLIRRAVRFSKDLGISSAFMYELTEVVAEVMGDFYPNVKEKQDFIKDVIKGEEERFLATLDEGIKIYQDLRDKAKESQGVISGKDAFKLYDTYGFPFELTVEYAALDGLTVDESAFNEEMALQKERARQARKQGESMQVQSETFHSITSDSKFLGYDTTTAKAVLSHIVKDDHLIDVVDSGQVEVIFDQTPFYAESGGQIADTGTITSDTGQAEVNYVYKGPNGQNVHVVTIIEGVLTTGETYDLQVDKVKRRFVMKNHTATHLLHQALKDVIGAHANQAGSLVEAERLRFDFSHLESISADDLKTIENIVNEKIYESLDVVIDEIPISEAKEKGAMALFGEKYGDVVRVVDINGYSVELCGGIHVKNTDDIGVFKILSESGIGAGIRRIEAVTSKYAVEIFQTKEDDLKEIAKSIKTKEDQVVTKVNQLVADKKDLQKQLEELKHEIQQANLNDLSDATVDVNGVTVIRQQVEAENGKELREQMDLIKSQNQDAIIALGAITGDKVALVVTVPNALTAKVKAGDIMKGMANIAGGKGGGRPDMAQGGGTNPESITAALQFVEEYIKDYV